MFEVANQLPKDPRLIRIRHATVHPLLHGDGEDFGPRQVVERDSTQLALVDVDRMNPRCRRQLVGDSQNSIEPLLQRDVKIRLDLRALQARRASLDLDERRPLLRSREPSRSDRPGSRCSSPTLNGTSMKVPSLPEGAPRGFTIDSPNSGTAATTAISADVARRPPRPAQRRAASVRRNRSACEQSVGNTSGDLFRDRTHQARKDLMRASHIFPNLKVPDIEAAKGFYVDFLGLTTEDFNLGWVARFTSPDTGANVQLVTRDATSPEDSVISVATSDIDNAYEEAQRLGYEIVHPLQDGVLGCDPIPYPRPGRQCRQTSLANHRD